MKGTAVARSVALAAVVGLGAAACGDVKSELITGADGGSAGGTGGTSTGGTSSGASGASGSGTSGAGAGGANAGGASAGSAGANAGSGGASGGSGGMPECLPETADMDCISSDRIFCHPDRLVCVECVYDAHCDPGEECSEALGECAERCSSTADCTDDEDRFCDTTIGGFCVECLNNSDCPSNQCSNWSCD